MFVAHFDESGQLDAGGFVCLAGFVAPEEKWVAFDTAWNAALVKHGAPYLHTTDLTNFKRLYKDWTPERRDALMADLMEAIHAAGRIAALGAVMSVDDYNSFSDHDKARMRDPFFPLFQEVIRGAALDAHFEPPDVKVKMIYSQQDEFGPSATKLWEIMQGTIDFRRRMGSLEFADMRIVPGLQAADLLAFELRRYYQNKRNRPDLRMRWPLRQILLQQRVLGIHYIRFLPRWSLRLQLSPAWVFTLVTTAVTILVAIPAYFNLEFFGWSMGAPELPAEDERHLRELQSRIGR
jgi:hypothetical protein